MFKFALNNKLSIIPLSIVGFIVLNLLKQSLKSKTNLRMNNQSLKKENLLEDIQERMKVLEKKVDVRIEKDNVQLSLKGLIFINQSTPLFLILITLY